MTSIKQTNLENTNNMENNIETETLYSLQGIFQSQLLSMDIIKHDTRDKSNGRN